MNEIPVQYQEICGSIFHTWHYLGIKPPFEENFVPLAPPSSFMFAYLLKCLARSEEEVNKQVS